MVSGGGLNINFQKKKSIKNMKRRKKGGKDNSVREVRRTRRTCQANFQNVRRRAAVKFNQMSGGKHQMSGQAKKDFAYTGTKIILQFQDRIYKYPT